MQERGVDMWLVNAMVCGFTSYSGNIVYSISIFLALTTR